MNIEAFRNYCLRKRHTSEELPFGPDTLVFKVFGKIFALTNIDTFDSINLKCEPELATRLREQYPEVRSGYHMNKKHWNTISLQGGLSDAQIMDWIDHSYDRVVAGLPAGKRKQIEKN